MDAITGKIKDSNSESFIEYATISLFNQKDSSLVTGTITMPDGSFILNELPYGMFYLEASFVGFEKSRLYKNYGYPAKK
ncbi:MAG: carboxypeptidase regulatory-like domain-containing protein [Bacteroidales bacterium]|nr:carboxypeptidase regulatory-like domain-containing protein [Bacteroidales bacterium]